MREHLLKADNPDDNRLCTMHIILEAVIVTVLTTKVVFAEPCTQLNSLCKNRTMVLFPSIRLISALGKVQFSLNINSVMLFCDIIAMIANVYPGFKGVNCIL